METVLITVGKTRAPFVRDGIEAYAGRLRHYLQFSINELPDIKASGNLSQKEIKDKEGRLILDRIISSDYVVLLDEKGDEYTSEAFADRMRKLMNSGRKRIVFVVGGPYGFSGDVYNRADAKLSLSKMTFNHEMVRMFFVEQIYRAMTILRGEPYHHA